MAGVKDLVGVRQILLGLYNEGQNFLRSAACNVEAVRSLQRRFPQFSNRDHLEAILTMRLGEQGDFGRNYIYVKSPAKHPAAVVMLHGAWNFVDNGEELRLRLGIFVPKADGDEALGFIGYRFETREGPGVHNYHHAQPISSFDNAAEPMPEAVRWYPTRYPTIPLDAKDVVQLTACTVISVHGGVGLAMLKKILKGGPAAEKIGKMRASAH